MAVHEYQFIMADKTGAGSPVKNALSRVNGNGWKWGQAKSLSLRIHITRVREKCKEEKLE